MFARRTLTLAAAVLALGATACLPSSAPPRLSAGPDARDVLDAAILPPHYGQVPIHLGKPAYVALFEVIPGRGVSLLYPQSGTGFVQTRETWVPLRYSPQRWMYANYPYSSYAVHNSGRDPYGYGYGRGSFEPVMQPPRYLFLVASEDPLAVEQFQGEIGAVRQYLGHAKYTSLRPEETMEELAFAILPYMAGERWVSDVYVDWGFDWGAGAAIGTSAAYTSMQPVLCSNGSILYAPWRSGWGFEALPCVPMQWVGPPGTNVPVVPGTPQQPGDSTAAPPSGEERRRASGGNAGTGEGTRERASDPTRNGRVITDEAEIRTTMNALREQGQRARVSDDLSNSLHQGVRLRQRADAMRGGTGPVVSREPSGRPTPVTGTSSSTVRRDGAAGGDDAARRAAEERRREVRREQAERDRRGAVERDRENARRRADVSRPEPAARREPPASRPAPETRSTPPSAPRERPSSPPPSSGGSSGSSGSSGGRSRVPPPSAS